MASSKSAQKVMVAWVEKRSPTARSDPLKDRRRGTPLCMRMRGEENGPAASTTRRARISMRSRLLPRESVRYATTPVARCVRPPRPSSGQRLEEQLVHPAVGHDLGAAPRRHGQDHVERA